MHLLLNKREKNRLENLLVESLENVHDLQLKADKTVKNIATGKKQFIHETMLALSKADIAFCLTMQVRNKVIEVYQEIMRMPVLKSGQGSGIGDQKSEKAEG